MFCTRNHRDEDVAAPVEKIPADEARTPGSIVRRARFDRLHGAGRFRTGGQLRAQGLPFTAEAGEFVSQIEHRLVLADNVAF
jgi:hypothetical protein